MDEKTRLARQFETHRTHLRAVAYRMLGTASEADDAVQEAWLRLSRSDADVIDNLGGWLTTATARLCLDALRSRKSRREDSLGIDQPEPAATGEHGLGPEDEVQLSDSVGVALLVVLETLAPAERVAFVLHDLFDLPFDEIAPVVGRSPTAARQLASRARRRVRGASRVPDADFTRQREIVGAFLAASRGGDFGALLALLDPDVVLRADGAAVQMGAQAEVRGAEGVAETFKGRAMGAQAALVDGVPGLVWAAGGKPKVVFGFSIAGGRIVGIELIAEQARIGAMDLAIHDS